MQNFWSESVASLDLVFLHGILVQWNFSNEMNLIRDTVLFYYIEIALTDCLIVYKFFLIKDLDQILQYDASPDKLSN